MLTCEHEAIAVEMLRAADRASAVGVRSMFGPPRPSASRRVRRPPDPEQLQQVVGEADEEPLGPDLDQAAEREATEVARVLDLPERRLRDRLAQGIDHVARGGLELGAHRADHRPIVEDGRRRVLPMFLPVGPTYRSIAARWPSGSQSLRAGGSRNRWSGSYGLKVFMGPL